VKQGRLSKRISVSSTLIQLNRDAAQNGVF